MGRILTDEILNAHKEAAEKKLDDFLCSLINSNDAKLSGKADKLCYWIEDWIKFLEFEPSFSPNSLRRYKRGEIIKVHLGFNVGSEEGGLHYAVVIDKNNAKTSPVVTIVPLTSVKPNVDVNNLKKGSIYLGNELFTNLNSNLSFKQRSLNKQVSDFDLLLDEMISNNTLIPDDETHLRKKIQSFRDELDLLTRMAFEVQKMRNGSIALVNQITTISKIRIYDPKTDHDILSGIKLSNEKLDLIDMEIAKNYTNISK